MRPRIILSLSNFFAVAHYYLIVYILTPYLATLISPETAPLSVALGAIITLSVFPYLPRMVVRHGPQRMAIVFAGIEGIVLLFLAAQPSALLAVMLVALACAIPPFIVYQLDLLLEACVIDEGTTGRVRTGFTSSGNIALVLAPVLVGILLNHTDHYGLVFMAAALSVVPFILLMMTRSLPQITPPSLKSIRTTGIALMSDKDERAIAFCNLLLQIYTRLAPLYVPLYLHTVLGIPWSSLGWVIAVSLVPLAILEYPAGWLADTKIGDRVLMATGFVIGGLSLCCLAFVTATTPLWTILVILLFTCVGSSFIESMTESHFFRRMSADDAEAVSIFRMMRPLGALTAPIIGTILLSTAHFWGLFTIAGFGIMIAGLSCAYVLQNTGSVRNVIEKRSPLVDTTRC
jgi:MFS family permease